MSTCRWCTPGGASTLLFLQSYSSKALSQEEHDAANEDLCYCLECVIEYHKARDALPLVPKALQELEASRLINHFEKALNQEVCDEDELILVEDEQEIQLRGYTGPEFENNLRVPLLEILKYPYLLLHKGVGELCVESLCKMEQGNYSFQVFDKHPGIYLFLVHPNEMIRRWAISTARSLGKVDRDDYYELQEVFNCLFKVIELDLFENADIYLSSGTEGEKLNLLPPHLYDSSNYKNYWLGICMLLTILEDQALDSLILGPDKQTDLLNAILNTMDKYVEDESNDPFWPALQCFMVILDRLGSKVWGQAVDPTQAFQTIIGSRSYNKEIETIRNTLERKKIKMEPDSDCADDMVSCSQMVYECSTKKPNKDTGWKNAICPDYCPNMYEEMQTLVNLLQSDAGQDMRVHNSTFLWFIPYVQSVIDLKELGVAYIGEVIHHLYSEIKDVLDKKVQFCDKVTEFFILILVSIIELHRNKNCVQLLWFSSQKWVEALVKCVKLPAKLFSRNSDKASRSGSKITPSALVTSTSAHPQVNNTVQHACVQLIRSFLREGFQLGLQISCQKFLDQLNKQLRSTFILGWQLDRTETQDLQACLKQIVKSIKDRNKSTSPRVKNSDPYGTLHINIKQEVEETVELQKSPMYYRSSPELQTFSEFQAERILSKGEKTDCERLPFDGAECPSVEDGKEYQTVGAAAEAATAGCNVGCDGNTIQAYIKPVQNQLEDSSDAVKCGQLPEGAKLSSKGFESSPTNCIESKTLLDEGTSKCHNSGSTVATSEESSTILPAKNLQIDFAKFRTLTKKLSAIIGKDLQSKKESQASSLKSKDGKTDGVYSECSIPQNVCGNEVEQFAETVTVKCEKVDASLEAKSCSRRLSGDEQVVSSSPCKEVSDPDEHCESESDDNIPLQVIRKDLIKRKSFSVRPEGDLSSDTNVDKDYTTLRSCEKGDDSPKYSSKDPSLQPLGHIKREAETCNRSTYESFSDDEELRNEQVIIISDSDSSKEDTVAKDIDSSRDDSVKQSSSKKVVRKDQKYRAERDTEEQPASGLISLRKSQEGKEKLKSGLSPGFEENDSQFFEFETENEVYSVWQDSQLNSSKDNCVTESRECPMQTDKNIEDLYNDWGYDTDYVPEEVIQLAVKRAETNLLKKGHSSVKSEASTSLKKCTSEPNSEEVCTSFYSKKTEAQFQSVPCTASTDKLLATKVQRDFDTVQQAPVHSTVVSEEMSAKNVALNKKTNINKVEVEKNISQKRTASKNEGSSSEYPSKRKVRTSVQKKKSRVHPDASETDNRKPLSSAKRMIPQACKLPAVVPPKRERRGFEPASTAEKLGFKKKARKAFDLSQRSLNSLSELRNHGRAAGMIENKTRRKTKLISPQKLTVKGKKKVMASQEIQFFKQTRPKKANLQKGSIHSTLSSSVKKQAPRAIVCERNRCVGENNNQVQPPLIKPLIFDTSGNDKDNQAVSSCSPKQRNGLFIEELDPLCYNTELKNVDQAAPFTRIDDQTPKPDPTSADTEIKSETITSPAGTSETESGAQVNEIEMNGVSISVADPGPDDCSGDDNNDRDDADALFLTQYDPVDMDISTQEEGDYLGTCTVSDPVDMVIDTKVDVVESTKQLASDFPTPECKQMETATAPGTSSSPSAVSAVIDDDLFRKPGLPVALPKLKKVSSTKIYSSSSTSRNAQLCKELESVGSKLPSPLKTKSNMQPLVKRDVQRATLSSVSAPQDSSTILQALNKYVNNRQKPNFSPGALPSSECIRTKDNRRPFWDSMVQQYDQSYFVREILKWKYDMFANLSKFGAPDTLCQFTVTQIPDNFSKYDEYFRVFFPLLMLNTFEEAGQEWMNNQRTKKNTLYCLSQTGFWSESNMNRVDCQVFIQARDLAKQMHPKEDDLVLIWPQKHESSTDKDNLEMESSLDSLCIIGRISRFTRSTVNDNRREDLLTFLVSIQTLGNFSAYRGQQIMCEVISSLVTAQRKFRALLQLNRSPLTRAILKPCISAFTPREQADGSNWNSTNGYNRDQEKAINVAVAMVRQHTAVPKICLIHGPPGTGKSKTIVGLLFRILIEDQENVVPVQNLNAKAKRNRVLVCAPSNAAVDCLMKKIIIEFKEKQKDKKNALGNCGDINLLRLGSEKTISTDVLKFSLDYQVQNKIRRTQVYGDQDIQKKSDMLDRKLDELSRERAMFRSDKEKCQKLDEEIRRCSDERRNLGRMLKADRGRILEMQGKIILESHVICCTLCTSGSILLETAFRRLGQCPFSCVIVDEAGQACETETLIPLIHRCPKLVLVGDPEQLPPTVISLKAQEHRYGQPMMARLYHCLQQEAKRMDSRLPVLYLSTQYRMHPDICHFPSKFIYNKNLKTDSDTEAKRCSSNWRFQPYLLFDVIDGHENREQESYTNLKEIKLIVFLVKLMTSKKEVPFRNIGIITPYSAQKKLILYHLQQEFKDVGSQSVKALEVDTVDGFQGCEKDCIIVTCVRANALQGSIGFLASRQRLNVTITRARFSLFILGSLKTLMDNKDWNALIQDAQKRGAIIRTFEKNYEKDVNKIFKRKPTMQRSLSHPSNIHSVEKSAQQRTKSTDGGVPGLSVSVSSVSRHSPLPNAVPQVPFRPQDSVRHQKPVTNTAAANVKACSIPVSVKPPVPIVTQPSTKERPKDPRLARRAGNEHTSNQLVSKSVSSGTASHLDHSKNSSSTLLSGSVSYGPASSRLEHSHSSGTFNASTSPSSSYFSSLSYEASEDRDYRPLYRQGKNWSPKNETGNWSKDQDHRFTSKRPVGDMYDRQDRTCQQPKRRKE
ncbi:probable helicase senataxin isoform X2 [Protopterus annectens]|uniref:probable helicase senataxin isoform X2 n=1 Tax=Protopterus annectens TaxID=7888 RepID=UPI001CFA8F0A|nr:probable helicase senataxin isoform X2 [Protopterus annectens]